MHYFNRQIKRDWSKARDKNGLPGRQMQDYEHAIDQQISQHQSIDRSHDYLLVDRSKIISRQILPFFLRTLLTLNLNIWKFI